MLVLGTGSSTFCQVQVLSTRVSTNTSTFLNVTYKYFFSSSTTFITKIRVKLELTYRCHGSITLIKHRAATITKVVALKTTR